MNRLPALTLLAIVLPAAPACAETPLLDVPEAARDAAATVDRFVAALVAGDLERAAGELDPGVVVLESGGAERSAAEYLDSHAPADAEFLKSAKYTLSRRTARASGELAWVASEGEFQIEKNGEPRTRATTETMVLRATPSGWKIVHIHWSSRTGK